MKPSELIELLRQLPENAEIIEDEPVYIEFDLPCGCRPVAYDSLDGSLSGSIEYALKHCMTPCRGGCDKDDGVCDWCGHRCGRDEVSE